MVSLILASVLAAPPSTGEKVSLGGSAAVKPKVTVSIRADRDAVKPGDTFKVLVDFKVPHGTHFFGDQKNPNGIGVPTVVSVTAPEGYGVGKPAFPKTTAENGPLGPVNGYFTDTVVPISIAVPADAKVGATFEATIKAKFQYCDDAKCYPPKTETKTISLKIAAPSEEVKIEAVPVATADQGPPPPKEWPADLWVQLGFAFLAGLILNVMPCVLPVIAIKVLSFVQHAGESRGKLAVSNLTYALGVLSVFWVLSGFAIYAGMNWGQQFQSPWFTLLMAWAVFALSLSLLGVFEIPLPGFIGSVGATHREGLLGVFLSGAAATVLATPCTGPFLGPLLAWSLAQPPAVSFLTWTTVGVGMASPYILFAFVPAAVKLLPRPGQWMVTFKQVSGFIMMATAVFLLSTFKEKEPIVRGLFLFVATGFYFWLTGSRINVLTPTTKAWGVRAFGVAGALFFLSVPELLYPKKVIPWQPFSEQRLLELVKEGKPVLIDFTADWCFNCRVNEKVAIEKPAVLEAVKRLGVEPLYADYTNYSDEITKWIRKFGSDGIPLTVVIAPGDLERRVAIDGLFTESRLLEVLETTATSPAAVAAETAQR
jgi:suppressor for copper-sensitivity B